MREARLVGLSQDGGKLILAVTETGEEFAVPVDDRLRAALRGDRARLGQLEIQMESALRPRDIQARIRAGESVEAVAAVAQMPMERVIAFAGPVLAERDHIATLAQRASVRRRGGADAPTRNLGTWVTERLRSRQIDPASAEWDAWRRDDGRWAVRVSYHVQDEIADPGDAELVEKVAMFAYDAPGRYAVPDDDEARWLVGEQAQVLPPPVTPQPGERRLTAVADIDPGLAPDHGADSYEAGFEDTVSLPRSRQPRFPRDPGEDAGYGVSRPVARGAEPEPARGVRGPVRDAGSARDTGPTREVSAVREAGREGAPVREPAREGTSIREVAREGGPARQVAGDGRPSREVAREGSSAREVARESSAPVREVPREGAGREVAWETDRGPRRVQPVPNPDEEPTLIDVPIEQPPTLRPTVRAIERPVELRAETPPAAAPQEHTAPAQQQAAPTQEHPARAQEQPAPARRPAPTDKLAPAEKPAQVDSQQSTETPAAGSEPPAEEQPEPKKKPRRNSKRASVPSWDEIMFGKKAD